MGFLFIFGVARDYVGMDVHVKFGDSSQTILETFEGLISRRTNEHDEAYTNSTKRLKNLQPPNTSGHVPRVVRGQPVTKFSTASRPTLEA